MKKISLKKVGVKKIKLKMQEQKPISSLKNKRFGQTIIWKNKSQYVKGGKLHHYDMEKDAKIKSEHVRTKSEPKWRGDLQNSTV
jgi:hypothetical protein